MIFFWPSDHVFDNKYEKSLVLSFNGHAHRLCHFKVFSKAFFSWKGKNILKQVLLLFRFFPGFFNPNSRECNQKSRECEKSPGNLKKVPGMETKVPEMITIVQYVKNFHRVWKWCYVALRNHCVKKSKGCWFIQFNV